MKQTHLIQLAALALLPAALSLTSCSTPKAGAESSAPVQTRNGTLVLDTYQVAAIVTALDAGSRQVVLTTQDGRKLTFRAAPGINLRQVRVGDRVTATATEGIALFLAKPGSNRSSDYGGVVRATADDEGGVQASLGQHAGHQAGGGGLAVRAGDGDAQLALVFVNGERSVVKAGPKLDLAELSVGDAVSAQMAEALLIALQK